MALPEVGLQAVIDGMAEFNRSADDITNSYAEISKSVQDAERSFDLLNSIHDENQAVMNGMVLSMDGYDDALVSSLGLVDEFGAGLEDMGDAADEGASRLDQLAQLTALPALREVAAAAGQVGSKLVGMAKDATMTAARAEELYIVLDNMAKQSGQSAVALRDQVAQIKDLGITTDIASNLVSQFVRSNLDLAQASKLARVAQDAAVISMEDSSQALSGLLHGILTLQPEVLRYRGIIVDLQGEYRKWSEETGKSVQSMSGAEKQAVMLNAVLTEGAKIQGTYEASMGTASKQLRSFDRYTQELKEDFGNALLPAFTEGVFIVRDLTKEIMSWSTAVKEAIAVSGTLAGGLLKISSEAVGAAASVAQVAVALKTLEISSVGAFLGAGGLIAVVGIATAAIVSYASAVDQAHKEEATQILNTSESYRAYIDLLEDAGLLTYALSEGLYEVAKAAEAAGKPYLAESLYKAQEAMNSLLYAINMYRLPEDFLKGWELDPALMEKNIYYINELIVGADDLTLSALETKGAISEWAAEHGRSAEEAAKLEAVIIALIDAEQYLRKANEESDIIERQRIDTWKLTAGALDEVKKSEDEVAASATLAAGEMAKMVLIALGMKDLGGIFELLAKGALASADGFGEGDISLARFNSTLTEAADKLLLAAGNTQLLANLSNLTAAEVKNLREGFELTDEDILKIGQDLELTNLELYNLSQQSGLSAAALKAMREQGMDEPAIRDYTSAIEELAKAMGISANMAYVWASAQGMSADQARAAADAMNDLAKASEQADKERVQARQQYLDKMYSMEQDHASNVSKIMADMAQAQKDMAREMLAVEQDFARQRETLELQTAQAIAASEAQLAADLANLWTNYQLQRDAAERAFNQALADLKTGYRQAQEDADRGYADAQESLAKGLARDLESIEKQLNDNLAELDKQYLEGKEELYRQYNEVLLSIEEYYAQERASIEEKYRIAEGGDVEKTFDERLRDLQKQLAELAKTTGRGEDYKRKQILAEMEKLKAEELAALEKRKEEELAALKLALDTELAAMQAAYDEAKAEQLAAYQKARDDRLAQYEQDMGDLKDAHEKQEEEIRLSYERRLAELNLAHEREMDAIRIQYEAQQAALVAANAAQIAEINAAYAAKLVALDLELQQEKDKIDADAIVKAQQFRDKVAEEGRIYDEKRAQAEAAYQKEKETIEGKLEETNLAIKGKLDNNTRDVIDHWAAVNTSTSTGMDDMYKTINDKMDAIIKMFQDKLAAMQAIAEQMGMLGASPAPWWQDMGRSWGEGITSGFDLDTITSNLASSMKKFQSDVGSMEMPTVEAPIPPSMAGSSSTVENSRTWNLNVVANYTKQRAEGDLRRDLADYVMVMRGYQ